MHIIAHIIVLAVTFGIFYATLRLVPGSSQPKTIEVDDRPRWPFTRQERKDNGKETQ